MTGARAQEILNTCHLPSLPSVPYLEGISRGLTPLLSTRFQLHSPALESCRSHFLTHQTSSEVLKESQILLLRGLSVAAGD